MNELHHKTARFLVDNFESSCPPSDHHEVVIRGHRKIRSKTVRNLLTFAHHRFRNFLQ